MSRTHDHETSFDEFDELRNPPFHRADFERMAERTVSRRALLGERSRLPAAPCPWAQRGGGCFATRRGSGQPAQTGTIRSPSMGVDSLPSTPRGTSPRRVTR